jgi:hypothetical protein
VRLGVWSGALTVFAAFWLLVLGGLPLYVFPPAGAVPHSDVVLVLGPPMQERLDLAEQLRDEGLADRIVISVQASGGQTAPDIALCEASGVTCVVADPSTTRGEVKLMLEQGAAPSVIVVTSTPHVARTRYLFAKCYPGEVTVVPAERPSSLAEWTSQYVYQSFAFVKAALEGCA